MPHNIIFLFLRLLSQLFGVGFPTLYFCTPCILFIYTSHPYIILYYILQSVFWPSSSPFFFKKYFTILILLPLSLIVLKHDWTISIYSLSFCLLSFINSFLISFFQILIHLHILISPAFIICSIILFTARNSDLYAIIARLTTNL